MKQTTLQPQIAPGQGARRDLTSGNLPEVQTGDTRDIIGELDEPCPVCGAVCPNDRFCLNCGTMRRVRLE